MSEFLHPANRNRRRLNTVITKGLTLEEVVDKHIPNIVRYIESKGLLLYKEDIIQDVYLALLEINETLEIENIRSYLFGILRNTIKGYCRERKENTSLFCYMDNKDLESQKSVQHELLSYDDLQGNDQEKVTRLLSLMDVHLNEKQRKIIYLKYFENKTYKEISRLIGETEVNLRKIASRSKEKLNTLW